MEPVTAPAALAPTPEPTPTSESIPATHAAVAAGSVRDYREARRAERAGKPLAAVPPAEPAAPAEAAPAPAEPQLSKRQQDANERTRKAVEAATAQLREENERLRALTSPPAPAPAPAATDVPEWKRIAALPNAPKLSDFDTFEEFNAASNLFVRQELDREAQSRADEQTLTTAQQQRVETFVGQLNAAKVADPEFVSKLTADVKALAPFGALKPGEAGGPRNVIGELVYDSPVAPAVLLHLSQQPAELRRLETLPPEIAKLPAPLRVRAHIQWIVKQFGILEHQLASAAKPAETPVPPKTISTAPEPPVTLGSRPAEATTQKEAAIRRGDTRAYREARRAERAAGLRR